MVKDLASFFTLCQYLTFKIFDILYSDNKFCKKWDTFTDGPLFYRDIVKLKDVNMTKLVRKYFNKIIKIYLLNRVIKAAIIMCINTKSQQKILLPQLLTINRS